MTLPTTAAQRARLLAAIADAAARGDAADVVRLTERLRADDEQTG